MPKPRYLLNGAPIIVKDDFVITAGSLEYDDEQFQNLREQKKQSHIIYRDSQSNCILTIPITSDIKPEGRNTEIIAKERPYLVNLLVKLAIRRYFESTNLRALNLTPLRIFDPKNIRQSLFANPNEVPDWLIKTTVYELQTRSILNQNGDIVPLLTCDINVRNFIEASCDTLLSSGVDLVGRYVQVTKLEDSDFLSPKRQLVGRVVEVNGEVLVLDDHLEGYETIQSSQAYLEPRNENIKHVVFCLLGKKAERFWANTMAKEANLRQGPSKYEKIRKVFERIRQNEIELLPGLKLELGPFFGETNNFTFEHSELIPKPTFIFDPTQRRTDTWHQRGLDEHGPYDQNVFPNKKLRIAAICQKPYQGRVEQLLNKFFDGMPNENSSRGFPPYKKGFIRRFKFEKPEIQIFTTDNNSAESYLSACRAAMENSSSSGFDWNLAFIQIEESFKQYPLESNPYLNCKAFFFKRNIPVQSFTENTLGMSSNSLGYSLNQMSLASYAKIGGQPWLLKADSTIAHELVVGLGSCNLSESRTGQKDRIVGITTVFSGDGNYILNNQTRAVSYDDYCQELINSLTDLLKRVKQDQNWQETDPIRLVFHTFKPLKDLEIKAVTDAVAALSLKHLEFAFIHFANDHPFVVFDLEQAGAGYNKKGQLVPEKGMRYSINQNESLVCFTGPKDIKKETHGMPNPVLMRLHRNSTFTDMTYLTRQAFAFANHNWRSFYSSHLPITIRYSELIADLLMRMQKVPNWDEDAVFGKIGRTRWFL
ncbi:MAG: Piwi domain-containing protein [Candidatus Thiodiazotropha sp.]